MGIYSTLYVTRSKAVAVISAHLEAKLELVRSGNMPDTELETFLDDYLEPQLNNAVVVSDDSERQDDDSVPLPD